jgi:hypothetical protein
VRQSLGAGRSGTTLLRVILDSHPNIACGTELKVIPAIANMWYDFQTVQAQTLKEFFLNESDINDIFRQMIIRMLEKYRLHTGKARMAEKSPNNVSFFFHLHAIFPESPLIHVIRDGRDVICSLLSMNWIDTKTLKPIEYTRDPQKAAEYWVSSVQRGRMAGKDPAVEPRYFEILYENMVLDPIPTLKQLFSFIDEPWDPTVINFHEHEHKLTGESSADQVSRPLHSRSIGRWQKELKENEKELIKKIAGSLLIELGYANNFDW